MSYRSIVCGVTGSKRSHLAAREAARLARENQASLVYVYVVDVNFLKGMTVQLTTKYAEDTLAHIGETILNEAEGIAREEGVTPQKVLVRGRVIDEIRRVVVERQADLLVVGDEGRTFAEKVLFGGTVADNVAELEKQTGVPVKVVR
jgi:nucleotide-binding universal stress UspA family protein